ncbi:unnamed protein product [Rodentolepis nana]|uniref:CRC domain-containing protein n=1 Tax=Rodentolepis nana TaxID=102285 RepID=A0A0R3TLD3_RODNA|nr:unnamed protein product [Rodentolepis nana]
MGNNEESHKSMKVEQNHPISLSEGGGGVDTSTSVPLAPTATVVMASGSLIAIQQQQQPLNKVRKVRDELDPAPHHTPSDIKVLEILKRIRDEGNVGDDDVPPPKRKPGRSKMTEHPTFARQTPTPVLPQPSSLAVTNTPSVVLQHPPDSFKVPIPATVAPTTTNLRPKSVSSTPTTTQFRPNDTTPQTILLTTTNGTTPNIVTPGASLTLIQQKSPSIQPASVAAKPQQLELILPNGLRIPVSATTCAAKPETKFTPISAAKTGSLVSPSLPSATTTTTTLSSSQTSSTQQLIASQPSSTTSTSSNTQQICSCSRSKCLKLYCDCFAAGRACGESCNCRHCYNNLADDETKQTRDVAVRTALSRNPLAFKPKIEDSGKHVLGCRCKRSHCSKGYCECYLAKIPCNQRCRCLGCSNDEASSSNPSSTSSTASSTSTVKPNDVQLAFLTPTQIQQLGVSAGNAVSSLGVVKANILPTTNTDGSSANTPRTFTLNWPIKTLATANGTSNVVPPSAGRQSIATTTTEVPSIIFPQSFLTAVANQQTSTSVQQDLLKCLSSVLPQSTGAASSTQLIVPSLVQAATAAAAAAAVSSAGGQAAECGQATVSQSSKTTESQNGEEPVNGRGDNSEDADNYTGYTEEELAFMQRLQENRNSSSEVALQVKSEDAVEVKEAEDGGSSCTHSHHPSSNPPAPIPEELSIKLNSMLATLWRGSQVFINPPPPPVEQQHQEVCCQSSERPSSLGSLSPLSAPPSLCPPSGAEERVKLPSKKQSPVAESDRFFLVSYLDISQFYYLFVTISGSDEVLFLKQKVSVLEAQITQLTELIRAQGDVMSQLSDTIERLRQQYQTLSPITPQLNDSIANSKD